MTCLIRWWKNSNYVATRAISDLDRLEEFTVFRQHLDSLKTQAERADTKTTFYGSGYDQGADHGFRDSFSQDHASRFSLFSACPTGQVWAFNGWWPETLVISAV